MKAYLLVVGLLFASCVDGETDMNDGLGPSDALGADGDGCTRADCVSPSIRAFARHAWGSEPDQLIYGLSYRRDEAHPENLMQNRNRHQTDYRVTVVYPNERHTLLIEEALDNSIHDRRIFVNHRPQVIAIADAGVGSERFAPEEIERLAADMFLAADVPIRTPGDLTYLGNPDFPPVVSFTPAFSTPGTTQARYAGRGPTFGLQNVFIIW